MSAQCPRCDDTGFEIRNLPDGATAARPCLCSLENRGERLLRSAGIPRRYEHCTLEHFEPQNESQKLALRFARDWIERWPLVEHGLMFHGEPGTGKTHLVVAMSRELAAQKGARVVFRDQREFLKEIQATFEPGSSRSENDVLRPVLECPVLVLDDLGAGRTTAWARDVIHDIVSHRYNERLPLLLTTNLPAGEDAPERRRPGDLTLSLSLRDRLGDALMSRLYEMCRMVEIEGRDFRRGILHAEIRY